MRITCVFLAVLVLIVFAVHDKPTGTSEVAAGNLMYTFYDCYNARNANALASIVSNSSLLQTLYGLWQSGPGYAWAPLRMQFESTGNTANVYVVETVIDSFSGRKADHATLTCYTVQPVNGVWMITNRQEMGLVY